MVAQNSTVRSLDPSETEEVEIIVTKALSISILLCSHQTVNAEIAQSVSEAVADLLMKAQDILRGTQAIPQASAE